MENKSEKIERLEAQLENKKKEIQAEEEKLAQLCNEIIDIENELTKNRLIENIIEGDYHKPGEISDGEYEEKIYKRWISYYKELFDSVIGEDLKDMEKEKVDYEEVLSEYEEFKKRQIEEKKRYYDTLHCIEVMYKRYGDEYILPMGEIEHGHFEEWGFVDGKKGMIMNINGAYVVDGRYKFDTLDELINWAKGEYTEFIENKENDKKIKRLKRISVYQLEKMLDGEWIGEELERIIESADLELIRISDEEMGKDEIGTLSELNAKKKELMNKNQSAEQLLEDYEKALGEKESDIDK